MLKNFLIFLLLLFTIIGCHSNLMESYSYEKDTPVWLKVKIDSISTQKYYWGTNIFRYKWNNNYVFEFAIPSSSCMYCEMYYFNGTKVKFINDSTLQNYLKTTTDNVWVWTYLDNITK